jgi:hypothetical protein
MVSGTDFIKNRIVRSGGRMWQLKMTNAAKEWIEVATFDTVTAAARRIRELEGYPTTGVFLELPCRYRSRHRRRSV